MDCTETSVLSKDVTVVESEIPLDDFADLPVELVDSNARSEPNAAATALVIGLPS